MVTDKGISQNKIWQLTKDKIRAAAQSWILVRVGLMI